MKQYREIIVSQIDKIKTYSSLLATFNIDTSSVTISILCRGSNFYKCFIYLFCSKLFVFYRACLGWARFCMGSNLYDVFVWAQTCMMFLSGFKFIHVFVMRGQY